jgi:hypothetical protein
MRERLEAEGYTVRDAEPRELPAQAALEVEFPGGVQVNVFLHATCDEAN